MTEPKSAEFPPWLAWLIAIPVLVVAALLGFAVLLVAVGVVAVVALYLGLRVWWLRRTLRRSPPPGVIEAEYVVVQERETRHPRE